VTRSHINDAAFAVFIGALLLVVPVGVAAGWSHVLLALAGAAAAWAIGRASMPRPVERDPNEEPAR
jgi:hypothetical protein